jgi:hypothetical protein
MFKKSLIAAAIGLVAVGSAHAQTDKARLQAVPAANTLFISGASAPRSLIVGAGTDAVCTSGTKRIFRQDQSTGLGANTLRLYGIVCTGNALSGASGQDIAVYYSPIGSLWGVTPVRRALPVPRLNLANCPDAGSTGDSVTCTGAALPTQAAPDAGVSDLSKNIVAIAPNVPLAADIDAEFTLAGIVGATTKNSMATALSSAERATLTEKATGGTIFGVQVNKALRDALVARGGIYTTSLADGTPVLSRAEIASLMISGNTAAADAAALLGVPAGDFTLCRRLTGSGTQAVANAYFLNNPVSFAVGGGAAFATNADDSAGTPSSYDVQESVASSDVATCMNGAGYRMGILSIESAVPTTGGSGAYVAINGVAATKANVRNGMYDYYSEQVLLQNGLSGTKLAIFNALDANALSTQSICSNAAAMVLPGVTVSVANASCQMLSSRQGNQGGVNARR